MRSDTRKEGPALTAHQGAMPTAIKVLLVLVVLVRVVVSRLSGALALSSWFLCDFSRALDSEYLVP